MPITYKLLPLSELFDYVDDSSLNKSEAKSQFMKALDLYCEENNCKPGTPDRPKPPPATLIQNKTQAIGGNGGSPF